MEELLPRISEVALLEMGWGFITWEIRDAGHSLVKNVSYDCNCLY